MARWARKPNSLSVNPEKMGTFASVCPGVTVDSGTVAIVPEHLDEESTVSDRSACLPRSQRERRYQQLRPVRPAYIHRAPQLDSPPEQSGQFDEPGEPKQRVS